MKQNAIVALLFTTLIGALLGCRGARSEYSFTNVDAACRTDDVSFFAAHRTNLNIPLKGRMPGYTTYAIILAAEHGKFALVSNLLSFGAIATVTNSEGNTPLIAAMGAMTPPDSNIMTRLHSAGVDLNARNLQGETALMRACSLQPFPVVENLLSVGAEPNVSDLEGDRAINYASNTNKIRALLEFNASLSFTNMNGETPLDFAMRAKPELVPYLRDALHKR